MIPIITVVIPTHNPDHGRLQRTMLGLRAQTLAGTDWELVLVNNASARFPAQDFFSDCAPDNFSLVDEPELGLTAARRRGLSVARGNLAVLVDDDNELAPDYLAETARLFTSHPKVGVLGGRSQPEFESPPAPWMREFDRLLACRDLGNAPLISRGLRNPATGRNDYPVCAPIGAGMAIRRAAAQCWLEQRDSSAIPDRKGSDLTSAGDNDIVLCAMRAGWEVAYFPSLHLTHLIPAHRLDPDYLARLNRGIQKSWMQVLTRHEANPWPPLTPAGARLRQLKAWFTHQAWRSPAARIRWQGTCGHFEGRAVHS